MKITATENIEKALKERGYRCTSSRIALLKMLLKEARPLSIQEILELWSKQKPNQVTLYRALESLASTGMINRVDLNSGVARYEYTPNTHHHHLVCTNCKVLEDIATCSVSSLKNTILKNSKFTSIYSHTLEFFGLCNRCATN